MTGPEGRRHDKEPMEEVPGLPKGLDRLICSRYHCGVESEQESCDGDGYRPVSDLLVQLFAGNVSLVTGVLIVAPAGQCNSDAIQADGQPERIDNDGSQVEAGPERKQDQCRPCSICGRILGIVGIDST